MVEVRGGISKGSGWDKVNWRLEWKYKGVGK
jgi:hypothetical protein